MTSPQGRAPEKSTIYDKRNESIRIESHSEFEDNFAAALRSFLRRLSITHLFEERILPISKMEESTLFAAVRDRPWPPWGIGAQRIAAFIQAHTVGERSYALSVMHVGEEDRSNIGLRTALFKETLEHLSQNSKAEINYLVVEGSVLAGPILMQHGFAPSDDVVVADEGRYHFYRADAQDLLSRLHLKDVSTPELLAHHISPETLSANVLFQGALSLTAPQETGLASFISEIIAIEVGLFNTSLPGGPPPPGTTVPGFGFGFGPIVEGGGEVIG